VIRRLLLALLLSAAACTDSTSLGPCVGIDDEQKRDPNLVYEIDTGNVIVAVIFVETVIVPVWVALDETYCPVARKEGGK
jgi:hypothetical protein